MNKKGVFWGILIILAGFIGVIFGWNYVASAKQSQSWLTTEGTMVSATLSAHAKNGSSDGGYSTDISYTYQVDGQSYQSDHIAFNGARQYNNEAKA